MAHINTYSIYNTTTGEITKILGVPDTDPIDTILLNIGTGEAYSLESYGASHDTDYYVSGVKTTRPLLSSICSWNTTSITANGTSTATFSSSLPNPSQVSISSIGADGVSVPSITTVTDGSISITTLVPNTYTISITCFPYQDYTQNIVAT